MIRRSLIGAGVLAASCTGFFCAGGCGDATRETGTVVQTPAEDKASMEASAAAYRAQSKSSARPAR